MIEPLYRARCAVVVALSISMMWGCDSVSQPQAGVLPNGPSSQTRDPAAGQSVAPDAAQAEMYVTSLGEVWGFPARSEHDVKRHPNCVEDVQRNRYLDDIAADPYGNLIIPYVGFGTHNLRPHEVAVYGGPGKCGPLLGRFHDGYGVPVDAASMNAATGTIVIANYIGPAGKPPGNIAVCTLKRGCTKELVNATIAGVGYAVALAKNGDCWLTSENGPSTDVALTYWKGCTGDGETATGFQNTSVGSLSIDKQGNLVSIDSSGGRQGLLWVYSGCNPACTLVGGPFPLKGNPVYGALDAAGDRFGYLGAALGNYAVRIYKYAPTRLTFQYGFFTGTPKDSLGFTFSPALQQ